MMLPFFASIFMGYSVHLNFRHKNVNSDLLLMNIDAMASKEWGKKFARKYSTTWNEGPFLNSFGQKYIYTHLRERHRVLPLKKEYLLQSYTDENP